jgi:tetratricopeptide (TPR) repeat protein
LRDAGRAAEAEESVRRACALQPDSMDALILLGTILRASDRLDEAETVLHDVLRRAPDMAVAWNNLGIVLDERGLFAESESAYREALARDPAQYEAYQNLSIVLRDQDRWDEALAPLDEWVARSGGADQARGERALVLLQLEDYARGWLDYEARWAREGMIARNFGYPAWQGGDLSGKTLLVYAEQGIGDEIMFASCFGELIDRAGHVVVDCAPRLRPLFQRSFPDATVFASNPAAAPPWLPAAPAIDFEIAAGSVPRYLRQRAEDFPALPYLVADADRVARWKKRYQELGPGLKIGISWRGGRGLRAPRCSTALALWKELFALPDLQLINLQYGVRDVEWAEIRDLGGLLHHWQDSDPLLDLDDFAAQIAALDLVISVDNATVHMAGALGVPLWVLQPHCPDWRWGIEGRGRWYRDVRAFRQDRPGNWAGVFVSVREACNV